MKDAANSVWIKVLCLLEIDQTGASLVGLAVDVAVVLHDVTELTSSLTPA